MRFYVPVFPILLDYYISDRRSKRFPYGTPANNQLQDIMTRRWKEFIKPENWIDEPGTELEQIAYELTQSWKTYLKDGGAGAKHSKNWDNMKQLVMAKYDSIEPPEATDLTEYMEEFNERMT